MPWSPGPASARVTVVLCAKAERAVETPLVQPEDTKAFATCWPKMQYNCPRKPQQTKFVKPQKPAPSNDSSVPV